ncbi:MAG: ATP-binding protein [Gemmatimonadota bacterium]
MSQHDEYVARLREWLEAARQGTGPGKPPGALREEIETQLEALEAAQEELRSQAAELEGALEAVRRQRRRYEELFRTAPVAYIITDAAGLIRNINAAASELLNLPRAMADREPLPVFVHGGSEFEARLRRLARSEAVDDWEDELLPRGEAETVPVRFSAAPVPQPSGSGRAEELEIRWVVTDLRPERAARERERALHREQAARVSLERVATRARHVSEASARLLGVLDPEQLWATAATVLAANADSVLLVEGIGESRVQVRATGGRAAARERLDPLLYTTFELRQEELPEIPLRRVELALRRGEPEVVHGPGGSCLIVPLRSRERSRGAAVLELREGANVGEELLVARTLADRIALALDTADLFQEVVRSRRAAEESSLAESDMISVISHELRTPLMAVVSYAQLLEDRADELPAKLAGYVRQIAGAAEHQRQLVEQIMSYRRIQRGEDGIAAEELDYRQPAELAMSMARPLAEGKTISLELELPSDPVNGRCDPGRLRQILANLLTNAVRHTDEGHVRLALEPDHQWVVFRVADTGEGIAAEDIPRLFNRFWRGRGSRRRGTSGLGLTIARELVSRMHGTIGVESEPGVGTVVTVRLPRVAPEAAPMNVTVE